MIPRWRLIALFLLAPVAVPGSAAAAELLTIDQAVALSQATGRPILAMAGSKT